MASEQESYNLRVVTLGAIKTGKSSILKRFLFDTFTEKYRPTIEDLFTKDFTIGNVYLKVDFLDTEGSMQFPAMRRLSIANANAFLLVYRNCFEEIKEIRSDFQEVPIVFVGNKQDLDNERKRMVRKEDVAEWIFCELPRLRVKMIECSAKTNTNIREIFLMLQQLAKIPFPDADGLRRRSSAQARVDLKQKFTGTNLLSPSHAIANQSIDVIDNNNNHNYQIPMKSDSTITHKVSRSKPRSRSLIRRASKKVKNKEDADDCTVQ
ncbi:GTP-binding protein [Sarcoptes scabiei]|uniref:GTP-binding protein n=1 Tax=Sarcoptes scabiei TaxID=52283 RepID=A0A834REA5_SARSC|nr:GTP-binding protein [Sarcoptes scabiei]